MIFRIHGLHPVAVFRVDASRELGMGHLERCLTLARAMKAVGIDVHFISSDCGFQYYKKIRNQSFKLSILKSNINNFGLFDSEDDANQTLEILKNIPAKILVVDHYGIGKSWEEKIRNNVCYLIVIDDLANRTHYCDALIDQNVGKKNRDYEKLVNSKAKLFIGPEYALLRNEFIDHRRKLSEAAGGVTLFDSEDELKILISMGGVDSNNITGRIVAILSTMTIEEKVSFSVLIGQNFPYESDLVRQLRNFPHQITIYKEVDQIADFVHDHCMAIGSGGISALERCSLGIPSILVVLAENQVRGVMAMESIGAAIAICQLECLDLDLPQAIVKMLNRKTRESLREKSMSLVDCYGINRVMDLFWTDSAGSIIAKQFTVDDIDMVYDWSNDPLVRQNSFSQEFISYEEHKNWILKYLKADNNQHRLFILYNNNNAVGLVRLDFCSAFEEWRISYLVAAEFRGKGLSKDILKSALLKFTIDRPDITNLYAEVKYGNKASQKTFSRIGFLKQWSDKEDVLIYRIAL